MAEVNTGLTKLSIRSLTVIDTTSDGIIYAGTLGGRIFRSEDKGNRWIDVSPGSITHDILSLAVMGTTLFASISNGEISRSDNKGKRMKRSRRRFNLAPNSIGNLFIADYSNK